MNKSTRPVFSSEWGRLCPECGQPISGCRCSQGKQRISGDGIARVRRETKGRGGKTVTVITGLPLEGEELKKLAGDLKRSCGSGGTLKDGVIEIQGDHMEQTLTELKKRGFTVKRAGG